MATGEPPPTNRPPPPFQFTLRQLMGAMGVICLSAALINWFGPGLGFLAIVLGISLGIAIFFATRRRFTEATFVIFIGVSLTLLLLPAIQSERMPYSIGHCQNNLRNLGLALQQYESVYGSFPPAYIADADGKPMHSWRVLLLPYIEQHHIYERYKFDEPWDGPNNIALAAEFPKIYYYDCYRSSRPGETTYFAVTGPQTMWPGAKSKKISDLKDGAASTILLVEVHNSGIHWMEPRDLDMSQMPLAVNSPTGLSISSGHIGGYAHVVFASGNIRAIDNNTSPKALRAALTIAGGEKDVLPASRRAR